MNCAGCGKPAILITNAPRYIQFAFCMDCAKKRFKSSYGSYKINIDDIENELEGNLNGHIK